MNVSVGPNLCFSHKNWREFLQKSRTQKTKTVERPEQFCCGVTGEKKNQKMFPFYALVSKNKQKHFCFFRKVQFFRGLIKQLSHSPDTIAEKEKQFPETFFSFIHFYNFDKTTDGDGDKASFFFFFSVVLQFLNSFLYFHQLFAVFFLSFVFDSIFLIQEHIIIVQFNIETHTSYLGAFSIAFQILTFTLHIHFCFLLTSSVN